jgi:thioredoxin 1
MKLKGIVYLFLVVANLVSCNTNGQDVKQLDAREFEQGITKPGIQLVDVRTTEEYTEKHIPNSKNINVNSPDFEKNMAALDKAKPVYFYCLSGGRSNNAGNWALKNGFKEVYNLDGGIMAWTDAKKPVETAGGKAPKSGMSFDDYLTHIKGDKLVLVDFNAVWCGPCKLLKPIVNKVIKQNPDKVQLLEIDVDKNPNVANTMNVTGIPLLILYKDGKELWRNLGLTDEETILEKVKKFSK